METVIAEADADVNEMGYLTTPGVRRACPPGEQVQAVQALAAMPVLVGVRVTVQIRLDGLARAGVVGKQETGAGSLMK